MALSVAGCHLGREEAILAIRREVYEQARRRNPNRWSGRTRNWEPVTVVRLNPERAATTDEGKQKVPDIQSRRQLP